MILIVKLFISIISIINPLGTIPVFLALTNNYTKKEITKTSFLTSFYVLIILLISFFIGEYILIFFGISINSLKIGGGLVVAISGFALLTGSFNKHKGIKKKHIQEELETKSEISLTPLSIPMLAGPGTISMLIGYSYNFKSILEISSLCIAMVMVSLTIFTILYFSRRISSVLGANGINGLSRIIGFILISIGVELIISTIITIFKL